MSDHEVNQWELEVIQRLTRIETHCEAVPKLSERVDSLESTRDKQKGVMWVLSGLWAMLSALVGWHLTKSPH